MGKHLVVGNAASPSTEIDDRIKIGRSARDNKVGLLKNIVGRIDIAQQGQYVCVEPVLAGNQLLDKVFVHRLRCRGWKILWSRILARLLISVTAYSVRPWVEAAVRTIPPNCVAMPNVISGRHL
jgi:hypothetical protein